jgi:hypothetical protein
MMPVRRAVLLTAVILLGVVALILLRDKVGSAVSTGPELRLAPPMAHESSSPRAIPSDLADTPSHLAGELNAPNGNIRRDLEVVSELFVAWQSNFPREGNPVGDNAEITAALTGHNPLNFAFVPPNHRAINTHGELCDRWGTPFRLHQRSGTFMEIRSAGPDRKFATADDVSWPAEATLTAR